MRGHMRKPPQPCITRERGTLPAQALGDRCTMQTFLGALINGLALGMAYALIAVGYSMVFGVLRLINFSHSAVYTFGAYMVYLFVSLHFGLAPAILLAAQYLGSNVRDPMAFVILILILILKPAGLFGKKGITKV